jgi:hypothetical protein
LQFRAWRGRRFQAFCADSPAVAPPAFCSWLADRGNSTRRSHVVLSAVFLAATQRLRSAGWFARAATMRRRRTALASLRANEPPHAHQPPNPEEPGGEMLGRAGLDDGS